MSWQPRIYRAVQSWRLPETPIRSLATAAGGRKTNQQERAIRLRNMAKKGKIGLESMPKASRVRDKTKYKGPPLFKAEHQRFTSGGRQEAFKASEKINALTTKVLKGTLNPEVALASAQQMVEDCRNPHRGDSSSILYGQLIRLSVLAKKGQEAFKLFNQMKNRGMFPTFRTMSTLLKFGLKDLDPDPAVNTDLTTRFESLFSDIETLREEALEVVSATRSKQDSFSALLANASRKDVLEEIRREPTQIAVTHGAFCSWLASCGQQDRSLTIAERFHGKFGAIMGGFPHITTDLVTLITVAFLRSSHEITDQSAGRLAVLWRRYLQVTRDGILQEDGETYRSRSARGERPADMSPSQRRVMRLVDIARKTQHPDLCDVALEMLQDFTDIKPFGQKAMPQGSLPESAHGQEIALAYVYGMGEVRLRPSRVRGNYPLHHVLRQVVSGSSYKSEYPITLNFFVSSARSVLKARNASSLKSRPGETRLEEEEQIPLAQWKLMALAYEDAKAARQLAFPRDALRLVETIQQLRHSDIIQAGLPFWCYFDALQTLSKGPEGAHNPDLNRLIAMYLEGRRLDAAAGAASFDSSVESVLNLATQILVDQTGDLDATASDTEVLESPAADTAADEATIAMSSAVANSKKASLPSEASQAMDVLFDFFIALRASIASPPGKDNRDLQPGQIPFRSVRQLKNLHKDATGGKSVAAKKTIWQLSQSYLTLIQRALSIPSTALKPEQKKVLPFMKSLRVHICSSKRYMMGSAWAKAIQEGRWSKGRRPAGEARRRPKEVRRRRKEVRRRPKEVRRRPKEVRRRPKEVRRRPKEVRRRPKEVRRRPKPLARRQARSESK